MDKRNGGRRPVPAEQCTVRTPYTAQAATLRRHLARLAEEARQLKQRVAVLHRAANHTAEQELGERLLTNLRTQQGLYVQLSAVLDAEIAWLYAAAWAQAGGVA